MRILLTGGRSYITLDLARKLHAAGHTIFALDTHTLNVCRFSNTIEKLYVVPSPRDDREGFVSGVARICKEAAIDWIIPIAEDILYLAQSRDQLGAELFSSPFELVHTLHNKWSFHELLMEMGIPAPKTYLIENDEQLKSLSIDRAYALKACYSRASQNVFQHQPGDALPKIEFELGRPWVAQEWLEGEGICTYSICRDGKVQAHSSYPVAFAPGGKWCLSYTSIDKPRVLEWVENLVARLNFTGQIGFDFILNEEGMPYPIECNPRATSGVHLFSVPDDLDQAFFGEPTSPIVPHHDTTYQLVVGMLLYGWKTGHPFGEVCKQLFNSKDVIFSKKDLLPFLMMPLIFLNIFTWTIKWQVTVPKAFTRDFDWDGDDPAGTA